MRYIETLRDLDTWTIQRNNILSIRTTNIKYYCSTTVGKFLPLYDLFTVRLSICKDNLSRDHVNI